MPRSRPALALVLAVGLLTAAGVVAVAVFRDGASEEVPTDGEARPGAGATLLAGSASVLALTPTLVPPVTQAVTIEAAERGAAAARIGPVRMGGSDAETTIVWEGGTPLQIEPGGPSGGIAFDPTPVRATPVGLEVSLDGTSARLTPGSYRIVGPVAVGSEGLARPADNATFEATEATRVTFEGAALLRLPPEPITLEGPGTVHVEGDFEVTTTDADRRMSVIDVGNGPYRFDLVWVAGALEVDGDVRGPISGGSAITAPQNST